MPVSAPQVQFHLLAKPAGPACNLACTYCFYLSRWDQAGVRGMSPGVLEAYIRDYLAAQPDGPVDFTWQGGEPTLLGIEFFRTALAHQRRFRRPGQEVSNSFQTNGVLLNREWCTFLRDEGFLVGLSIDGPREIHDRHRLNLGGQGSFDRVFAGLEALVAAGTPFNTLTVVTRQSAPDAQAIYRFLRRHGNGHLQLIPLVERRRSPKPHDFAGPPAAGENIPVSDETVPAADWGAFLAVVFAEWLERDVGRIFVRDFENWLGLSMGLPSSLCTTAPTCGRSLAVEADGTVYSCDHYVYPEYALGRVGERPLAEMVLDPRQRAFGDDKASSLSSDCRACPWLTQCGGGCPKHRFAPAKDPGDPRRKDHLCRGWQAFLPLAAPAFKALGESLRQRRDPAGVMRDRVLVGQVRQQARTLAERTFPGWAWKS